MNKSVLLDLVGTNEGRLTAHGKLGIPGKLLRCLLQPAVPALISPPKDKHSFQLQGTRSLLL